MNIRYAVGQSSLGAILVAATDVGVCAIFLGEDPDYLVRDLQERFSQAAIIAADSSFLNTVTEVVRWVEQPTGSLQLPLDIHGTEFQRRVWEALRQIPFGQTVSYTQIAEQIGQPTAARAVAGACAANHISLAIPCHRVIRTDESLSGYRWGIERKKELLSREQATHSLS